MAAAWLRMDKRSFPQGIHELTAMINKIPPPTGSTRFPGGTPTALVPDPFEWAGQLRDYAVGVSEPSRQLDEEVAKLDAAVQAQGPQADALYQTGRKHTAEILADFDKKIAEATGEADIGTAKMNRKQLTKYSVFPINQYKDQVLSHLDE